MQNCCERKEIQLLMNFFLKGKKVRPGNVESDVYYTAKDWEPKPSFEESIAERIKTKN